MYRNIYNIALLSFIFALTSCGEKSGKTTETETNKKEATDDRIQVTQAQFENSKMSLAELSDKPFLTLVSATGMIDVPPENRAIVSATMGGYIRTTPLLIGDKVKKGQLLLTIENPEFVTLQQQYMEINEQLSYLKAEYERQATMKAENITSQKSFLKAESEYKTAIARHTGLDRQLRMLNLSPTRVRNGQISSIVSIYSPISGSITKVNITKGSYVSPATSIMEIINNDHIHLELSVFEKDIMKIKRGQKIEFKIPEASSEIYRAAVHLVGKSIETDRTVKVHGHLDDETGRKFLPGMFVDASIVTDSTLAKALPSESVVLVDKIPYVLLLVKKEGNFYYFNQVKVALKTSYNGYSLIESKQVFKPNAQFLSKGAFNLLGE